MNILAPTLIPNLQECAILLDVDGTIVDIAPTPLEVWVPPSLRDTMSQLSARTGGATALVSGRSVHDLDLLFAPLQLPAVGGHGAEYRPGNGTGDLLKVGAAPLDDTLRRQFATVTELGRGVLIEDKGYAVALHYRLAPELEHAVREAVSDICEQNPSAPIEVLPGKAVVEIKRAGFSKATGVRELMSHPPFVDRQPIFIGDDVTDELVFAIIPEFNGLAFSVGRIVDGVNGHFETPQSVRDWLARIVRAGASAAQ